jgi:hypothetical protein
MEVDSFVLSESRLVLSITDERFWSGISDD